MSLSLLLVVPTLNSYSLLPRLLSSLQQQSWPGWRLLFVDGQSTVEHRHWLTRCCIEESRCSWVIQDPSEPGIFGAMNHGFAMAYPHDWLLFWGSDDWAAGPDVFLQAITMILSNAHTPDVVVCRGRYVDAISGSFTRPSVFHKVGSISIGSYKRALFLGSTPPHQGTFFGPGVRSRLQRYDTSFMLSADLDYFLQLARVMGLSILSLDLELVHMADAGVSGIQTQRRLHEVRKAYRHAFGFFWLVPFVARYLRRFTSLVSP